MNDELVVEQLSEEDARKLTEELREACEEIANWIERAQELVVQAYAGRAWAALGYETWQAYCDAELPARPQLTVDERRSIVSMLRQHGLSTRAISAVTGAGYGTTQRDIRSTDPNGSVQNVQSLDGRTRPSTQPQRESTSEPQAPARHEPPPRKQLSEEDVPRSMNLAVAEVAWEINALLAVDSDLHRKVTEVVRLSDLVPEASARELADALSNLMKRARALRDLLRRN